MALDIWQAILLAGHFTQNVSNQHLSRHPAGHFPAGHLKSTLSEIKESPDITTFSETQQAISIPAGHLSKKPDITTFSETQQAIRTPAGHLGKKPDITTFSETQQAIRIPAGHLGKKPDITTFSETQQAIWTSSRPIFWPTNVSPKPSPVERNGPKNQPPSYPFGVHKPLTVEVPLYPLHQ